MKIALVTDGIQPYVIGGMQRHSFFIAKYLAKNKVFVDLYHCWQNKEADIYKLDVFTEEEKKYIRSFVIDFPAETKLPSPFGKGRGWGFPGHYLRSSYRYSEKIYEVLKKNLDDVDFIYVKGFAGWKLVEEKKKGRKLPPVGIKFHGLNMFQKPPSFRGWLEQLMFRGPVKFNIANADYTFSYGGKITEITRRIGVPAAGIIEIPTGINREWVRDSPGRRPGTGIKFLYVGRYERLKGIQELSQAILNLHKMGLRQAGECKLDFEFHFVGPIPEKYKIFLSPGKGRGGTVVYHGQISPAEEIKKIMDNSDVLVLPSYSEGMPNVIIEAMSRGLAVIATDVGAVNCLVSPENGFLLEACSVKNIEKSMVAAINLSGERLFQMKENSIKKIKEDFLWENIAGRLMKEIEKIIPRK